jgi:hypothetical protein
LTAALAFRTMAAMLHRLGKFLAMACVAWSAWDALCAPPRTNTMPLTFGMTPQDAATALGASLVYVAGTPGNEVFRAEHEVGNPGLYPTDERLYLQFRRGTLTGWKGFWRVRPLFL